jgi:hypothetical protein
MNIWYDNHDNYRDDVSLYLVYNKNYFKTTFYEDYSIFGKH